MPSTDVADSEWTELSVDGWSDHIVDPTFEILLFHDEVRRSSRGQMTWVLRANGDLHGYTARGEFEISEATRRVVLDEWATGGMT